MTQHKLLEELRLADPAPVDAKRPEAAWSSAVVLQIIQQRSGTMQRIERKTEPPTPSHGPSRRRGSHPCCYQHDVLQGQPYRP